MAEVIFSQSGGELRIQDGGSGSQQWNLETRSQVSIGVCSEREKLPTGLEGLGSVLSYFLPSENQSRHIIKWITIVFSKLLILCKRDLCPICKQGVCHLRWMLFSQYKIIYHWSLLSWYVVAPKGAVFWFKAFFLTGPEVQSLPKERDRLLLFCNFLLEC